MHLFPANWIKQNNASLKLISLLLMINGKLTKIYQLKLYLKIHVLLEKKWIRIRAYNEFPFNQSQHFLFYDILGGYSDYFQYLTY